MKFLIFKQDFAKIDELFKSSTNLIELFLYMMMNECEKLREKKLFEKRNKLLEICRKQNSKWTENLRKKSKENIHQNLLTLKLKKYVFY